ncbi:MAG: hypothetical protein ACFFDI_25075 [Promethearchaeota archaeon]
MSKPGRKKGTLEQWKEIGDLSKEIYDKLVDLCVKAGKIMPIKDWQPADKARVQMSQFKAHAENIMFSQLGEDGGARIDIFYPR